MSSSSNHPIVPLPSHHPLQSSSLPPIPPNRAAFHLPEATQTTVVTTTTTTTIHFPPILLPRPSTPPAKFSTNLHPRSLSKATFVHQNIPNNDNDKLPPLDAALYPLASVQLPPDWADRGLPFVLSNGKFAKLNPGTPTTAPASPAQHPRSLPPTRLAGASARPAPKRPASSHRVQPTRSRSHSPPAAASLPPPPRKRARLEHTPDPSDLEPLPGSPVTHEHDRPTSPPSQSSDLHHEPLATHPFHSADALAELSTLVSLPTLTTQFARLPPALQQYTLFNLLRHSPLPVLQFVHNLICPALKRDFIKDLPPEIAVLILCKLDGPTLCRAACVSRVWNAIVDGSQMVWRERLVEEELWVGNGAEEAEAEECEMVERGVKRSDAGRFARRWKAGVWRSPALVAPPDAPRSPASDACMRAAESSTRAARPRLPDAWKLLYRKRFLTRRNWLTKTAHRTSFEGHALSVVTCIQFDWARMVAASDDNVVHSYELRTGRRLRTFVGHQGGVWALQYVGDTLVTGSTDRTVRVWDMASGRNTHVFEGHTSTVRCLQIVEPVNVNPGGEPVWEPAFPVIVTGSRDYTLRVWRLPTPEDPDLPACGRVGSPDEGAGAEVPNGFALHFLRGHTHAVRSLAASGRTMVSGSYDCTVRAWDIMTGTCTQVMRGHTQKIYSVVLDGARGRCVSGSMDNTVRLWDLASGTTLRVLGEHSSLVGLLGLTPRRLVSAAADATLRIWDPATGLCRQELKGHLGAITCFAHDELRVVSGADGTLKLWNGTSGELVGDVLNGYSAVWQVGIDDRFCVVAVQRGTESEYVVLDYGRTDGRVNDDDDDDDDVEGGDEEDGDEDDDDLSRIVNVHPSDTQSHFNDEDIQQDDGDDGLMV